MTRFFRNDINEVLSNFYASPIEIEFPTELDEEGEPVEGTAILEKIEFKTAEHLFQALKFKTIGEVKAIAAQPTSQAAQERTRRPGFSVRPDWENEDNPQDSYKTRAMKFVLREKFNQTPKLRETLAGILETHGEEEIALEGDEENLVGELLTQIKNN